MLAAGGIHFSKRALTEAEEDHLLNLLGRTCLALESASTSNNMRKVPPFTACLEKYIQQLGPEEWASFTRLRTDSRVRNLVQRCERIADLDLHRENILFTGHLPIKIDFDALCSGPKALPFACAIVGGFLLYQDGDLERYLAIITARCSTQVEMDDLFILMELRALLGLGFFRAAQHNGARDVDMHITRYLVCLQRIRAHTLVRSTCAS